MTTDTLLTVGVSVLTSGITAFAIISFRMGRYTEKVDQLENCNLNTRLSTLEGRYSAASIVQSKSPITLTTTGTKLLTESEADIFVKNNLNELIAKIKEKSPATAYDVQEVARVVIKSYRDDAKFIPLKDFAFKQGIDIGLIETVAAISLRDKALPQFGFTGDDVDKTTPKTAHKA